ncbi:MAG: hypothetical protein AAGF11_07525 [Myxococcota bacterium]
MRMKARLRRRLTPSSTIDPALWSVVLLLHTGCILVPNPDYPGLATDTDSGAGTGGDVPGNTYDESTGAGSNDWGTGSGDVGDGTTRGDSSDDTGSDTDDHTYIDRDGDGYGGPELCESFDDMNEACVDNSDDCDDDNALAFPGAALRESSDLCMLDADGDGWGDARQDQMTVGMTAGSDCYDGNAALNPGSLRLTAFLPYHAPGSTNSDPRRLVTIDESNAELQEHVNLSDIHSDIHDDYITTATINEDGHLYAADRTAQIVYRLNSEATYSADPTEISPTQEIGRSEVHYICGLDFGGDGRLYGVAAEGHYNGTQGWLYIFDPTTSSNWEDGPIELAFEEQWATPEGQSSIFNSCGMAYDCTRNRLLLANGNDKKIYSIDLNDPTSRAEVVRDLSGVLTENFEATGLEYDPTSQSVLLSTGESLYRVNIDNEGGDDEDQIEPLGHFRNEDTNLSANVSNLQYLPVDMD